MNQSENKFILKDDCGEQSLKCTSSLHSKRAYLDRTCLPTAMTYHIYPDKKVKHESYSIDLGFSVMHNATVLILFKLPYCQRSTKGGNNPSPSFTHSGTRTDVILALSFKLRPAHFSSIEDW